MLTKPNWRKIIVTSVLAGSLIGLTLLVFEAFQSTVGHGIAIASFGATALIVVFNPSSPGASPKAVFFGYVIAGAIALLFSTFLNLPAYILAALIIALVSAVQLFLNMVHPPAVAYSLSFVYGGYSFLEYILTLPAILGFFIAFGVLVFILKIIESILSPHHDESIFKDKTNYEKIELIVDRSIPYALVLLFFIIIIELVNPALASKYETVLGQLDVVIITLFVIDLIFKYRQVYSVKNFIKEYWLDIIATLPVFVLMRFFGAVMSVIRLEVLLVSGGLRVGSLSKLLKPIARFPRFAKLIEKIETGK